MTTPHNNPLGDRKVLEHAKAILEAPKQPAILTALEDQQYRFYTTANLLLHTLVTALIAELPPPKGGA